MPSKILIVDDSPEDAELLISLLDLNSVNFEFEVACNGTEGLRKLNSEKPDCVLIDYRLGHENGLDLLSKFLSSSNACPAIMLTGQGSENIAAESLKAGAADYVVKQDLTAIDISTSIIHAIERNKLRQELAAQKQALLRQGRLEALGEFSAGIAHDFNNLLGTLQYAVELMRREELTDRGKRSADIAIKTVERGSDLTSRLLSFAKQQPERVTSNNILEVWDNLHELIENTVEKNVEVSFCEIEEDIYVHCDKEQLENAILNLVLNSQDAILGENISGHIQISVRSDERSLEGAHSAKNTYSKPVENSISNFIEISVTDNGSGMSEDRKQRSVDPFFTTKKAHLGSGLGLSMVYGFVKQSNGDMHIESEEGVGTTIRIFLPRGATDQTNEKKLEQKKIIPGNGEKILLVDDEANLLKQMEQLLQDLNYKIICAGSGQEAINILAEGEIPDLIITDVVMPGGVNGFKLAKEARRLIENIPIIYMSGYSGFSNEEIGEVGAPFLLKPTPIADLSTMIMQVLLQEGSA